MKHIDDKALMLAIVRDKDRSAFEALYKKFVAESYNLASYITGSNTEADDIVQEAFHAIWTSGSSFDPSRASSVQSWVLRIVANKALRALRTRRKIKEVNDENLSEMQTRDCGIPEHSQQDEMSKALRSYLDRLPSKNRQCIALYFGAQLSQQEIGTTLGLPTRTVSFKIQKTLQELRQRLTKSGFATPSAVAIGAHIKQAIGTGKVLPKALEDWTPIENPQIAPHQSEKVHHKSEKSYFFIGLSIVTAMGIITYLNLAPQQSPFNATNPTQRTAPTVNAKDTLSNQTGLKNFHKIWTFKKPPPQKYFNVLLGNWIHRPALGNGGAMEVNEGKLIVQLLHSLRLPLKLTIRAKMLPPYKKYNISGGFSEVRTRSIGIFRNVTKIPSVSEKKYYDYVNYFSAEFLDSWVSQRRVAVMYIKQESSEPFVLQIRGNCLISQIEIEEIEGDVLPDLTTYQAAIDRIPPNERVGSVTVPAMQSVHSTQPVKIEFHSRPLNTR